MPVPNQITACASATKQGVYEPEVRVYNAKPHPKYGLLPKHYFFPGKARDRAKALAAAASWVKHVKDMEPDAARAYLERNCKRHY